jgi:ribA/ribD-fused uncharacterized protein
LDIQPTIAMPDILRFRDEYAWLSNFSPAYVELDWITYPTVEHAYQAAKTVSGRERERIRTASVVQAKRLGNHVWLRPDWEEIKLDVMLNLLRQKYCDTRYRDLLLCTDDFMLIEGNDWHDTFWGVDLKTGKGQNWLGNLTMQVRDEIRRTI